MKTVSDKSALRENMGFEMLNDQGLKTKVARDFLSDLMNLTRYFFEIPKVPLTLTKFTNLPFLSQNLVDMQSN